METPGILIDSISSDPNKNTLIAVLPLLDNDKAPIICVIKPNGKGVYESELIDSNFLLSVYGKDNGFTRFLENAVNNNNILYWDKKMSQVIQFAGLQLPQGFNKLDSNRILHKSKIIVNLKS